MMSPLPVPTTPPLTSSNTLPSSNNTPPRHDGSGNCSQQEDRVELVNRMREAVLTHYRNSPSAPDRPIDLTHVKDTSTTLKLSSSSGATTEAVHCDLSLPMPAQTEDDDDEEYVPPGLADFVANVNRELEQQQKEFLTDPSNICNVDTMDTEGLFYVNQNQPLENVATYENDTDDECTKLSLKNEILQRCDLLHHDVVLSEENENFAGIDSRTRNDPALLWSPDIFTSPTPINPVSLLSVSQIKHQVFASPWMPPLQTPLNNHESQIAENHEMTPVSPLHSLPQFSMSESNRRKSTITDTLQESKLYSTTGTELENVPQRPSMNTETTTSNIIYSSSTVGHEIVYVDETTKKSQLGPNQLQSTIPSTTLEVAMSRLALINSEGEEGLSRQLNLAEVATTHNTPSPLSMASPSKGTTSRTNQLLLQLQPIGRRASSPIYGYAPTPELNAGTINEVSPPPPFPDPQKQTTNRTQSSAPPSRPVMSSEMEQHNYQPPSIGSLLHRATKKLSSNSPRNEEGIIQTDSAANEFGQESIPDLQPSHPIACTSSLDETNILAPSPKQKFTNRPPQNKPFTTPSPKSNNRPQTDREIESERKPFSSPPKMSSITSTSVSETPSPLSMSSPRCPSHDARSAFVPSTATSNKKVISSLVPRFGTPPSPLRIKPSSRFTTETAERLSRPSKSPQPPISSSRRTVPNYASSLKKSISKEKPKTPCATLPSQIMNESPFVSPPVLNYCSGSVPLSIEAKTSSKKMSMSSINRLSQPSSRRQSVMASSTKPEHGQLSSKQFPSPPITHSTFNRPESLANVTSSNGNGVISSRRRTADRSLRGKTSKGFERISPTIRLSNSLPDKSKLGNLSVDTVAELSRPMLSYKLSSGFEKSFRSSQIVNPTQGMSDITLSSVTDQHSSPTKTNGKDIIDRLSRPTKARAIAIDCTLNPPKPDVDEEEHAHNPVVVHRSPSPLVMITLERLAKPKAARKSTMHASGNVSRKPTQQPGDKTLARNSTNASMKLPIQLDSSSHLLAGTAVSKARKTTPKKSIVRPPTPTRFVTGASDRLMKPTEAYRASATPSKPESIPQQTKKSSTNNKCNQTAKRQDTTLVNASSKMPRPLTVPRGPRCANLPPTHKQTLKKDCIESLSLAQVLDTFGKGLRDDFSVASAGSNFSRRSLTIPSGPKLATDLRGGERYKPPKMVSDASLADSNAVLQNGLRSPYHSKHDKRQRGPTIPISPKFAPIQRRERPKSTADLEVEEMEYFKGHQFKAKPPLHSVTRCSRFPAASSSYQPDAIPGFMKPTKATKLNSREGCQTSMGRAQTATAPNRSRATTGTRKHRPVGVLTSILTTNLGLAQRGHANDDGLKDLVEHAARAAKALAIREESRQEQLAQEEEERRELSIFKAKPIPRTTYSHNPIVPAPAPLVEPFSPELHTKQRIKERKEFDEYAEQERRARLEHIQAMEDVRQAEEDDEINERRRLPVSEGGMIPVAAPINSVLCNQ